MGLLAKRRLLQVVCAPATITLAYRGGTMSMQSHLSSHHPDKYGESSKGSRSQRKLDSFVRVKKCLAERTEEITNRIVEIVARDLWPISISTMFIFDR